MGEEAEGKDGEGEGEYRRDDNGLAVWWYLRRQLGQWRTTATTMRGALPTDQFGAAPAAACASLRRRMPLGNSK